jgi:hypothetical protein
MAGIALMGMPAEQPDEWKAIWNFLFPIRTEN